MSTTEEQYLEDLRAAGAIRTKKDDEAPEEAAPVEVPEPTEAAPVEAVEQKPVETEARTEAPVEAKEPFEGFNLLPEATRNTILERLKASDEAKSKAEELDRQYKQLHGKVAPTQAQLSKLQVDYTRAQQELQKLQAQTQGAQTTEAKKKFEEYKKNFPEEAAAIELATAAQNAEIAELQQQLSGLRKEHEDSKKSRFWEEQNNQLKQAFPDFKETLNGEEFKIWRDSLSEFERDHLGPLFKSPNAKDAIYVLQKFESDRLLARASSGLATNGSNATPQAAPAPARPLPDVDPDPAKRASLPVTSSQTRNDTPDPEREYADVVTSVWKEWKKKQQARA